MKKTEWKERMAKIKWATKKAGRKWNKKEINIASEMITKPLIKPKFKENWQGEKKPLSIKEILNG